MKGKSVWMAAAIMFLAAVAHATQLTVTDVKVAQRYPWNGLVDITYTVNCDDATKDVWVYPVGYDADNDKTVAMIPAHLTGDGVGKAVKSGTHRMTWDMATAMGKDYNRAAFSVKMHAFCDAAPYMVIDLSSGSESERYEVSYLAEEPEGGWGEEYLTTKMVFRLILPGRSLTCVSEGEPVGTSETVVDSPYYFAVYPMTQQQWCLIMGGTTGSPKDVKYGVMYNDLRGNVLGSRWSAHQQVDADSVCGKMRFRTGMTVDIPTYAQWYRAISADFMHSSYKMKMPNAWGIMDIVVKGISLQGEIGRDVWRGSTSVILGTYSSLSYSYYYSGNSSASDTDARFLGGWAKSGKSNLDDSYSVNGSFQITGYFRARLVVCPVSK